MEQSAVSALAAPAPWQRVILMFTKPRDATSGLAQRPTSLFPMVLFLVALLAQTLILYQTAIVPMQIEQMQKKVDAGQMPPEGLDRVEGMMRSPVGETWGVGIAVIVVVVIQLVIAGLVLVAVNFIVGGRISFKQAWSLTWWTSVVSVLGMIVSTILTLATGKFPVHLGLGVLAPPEQATSRAGAFIGGMLDALSVFPLWWLALMIIGASVISGKSGRALTWTFIAFYVAVSAIGAGLAALGTPAS